MTNNPNPDAWVGRPYKQPRRRRPDSDYEIESLTKGLRVLEALEGMRWEPVAVITIMERTELPRDVVDRSLKTLRMLGYADTVKGKWTIGKRAVRVATSISRNSL